MRAVICAVIAAASLLSACATMDMGASNTPAAAELASPTPIEGTTGAYMSPFTTDGVTAGWITKSLQVSASGQVGAVAGQLAGQELLKTLPFGLGGMLGESAGKSMARKVALDAIGGEAFLKSSSDMSFNSLNDMAVYMYVNHSTHPEYAKILKATIAIYPDLEAAYPVALASAQKKKSVS